MLLKPTAPKPFCFGRVAKDRPESCRNSRQTGRDSFCLPNSTLAAETHDLELNISERIGFSLYNGRIVGFALEVGYAILYPEDMQAGYLLKASDSSIACFAKRFQIKSY